MSNYELPAAMKAMVLEEQGKQLVLKELPLPTYDANEVLVKVNACGVCRTDLHVVDGDLNRPALPLIPGHEIIATVVRTGSEVTGINEGDLVGIPWLAYTRGKCRYCLRNQENLCENALFTGYTKNGGFAEYTVAHFRYCLPLTSMFKDPSMAPLLCVGLVGYRSYTMVREQVQKIGIYGFGAAAHIIVQIAIKQGKEIFAFTRDNDITAQNFALKMGAVWAGNASENAPEPLDAAIIYAPAGDLIPKALRDVDKGCTVVCGGIHMSDIPSFPYDILWGERVLRSVANLTRQDGVDFLKIISGIKIHTEVQFYSLEQANDALEALRAGTLTGAAVIVTQ